MASWSMTSGEALPSLIIYITGEFRLSLRADNGRRLARDPAWHCFFAATHYISGSRWAR